MTKVVLTIIGISLAFAVCISVVLSLSYEQRLQTLLTFLLSSLLDVVVLRPLVLTVDACYTLIRLKISAAASSASSKYEKRASHLPHQSSLSENQISCVQASNVSMIL